MIVAVESAGYVDARDALLAGNQVGAVEYDALLAALDRFAGMAGDDATAAEFAAAYDAAAGEAVAGIADVVAAFATLGRLTEQSLANHQQAESRSVIPGGIVHEPDIDVPAASYVSVLAATPPSSLGGDQPTLSPEEAWILDHVEGFVWPDADVGLLREAASAWRATAGRLDSLADCCGIAVHAFETQRSPEIPLAITATRDLDRIVRDLADSCAALGGHCATYADAVEARHAEIRALLQEILQFVVEGVVISAALGALTAGLGAGVGLAGIVARVAAQSPRFAAILSALRGVAAGTAASVRLTREAIRVRRVRLERFLRVPLRNEAGHLTLGPGRWRRGWLAKHEHSGSHTLSRHVGKTEGELRERVMRYDLDMVSSFRSRDEAEELLETTLRHRSEDIQAWLGSGRGQLILDEGFISPTGITFYADGRTDIVSGVRVILRRDPDMPDGYRIHTSFPQP